MKIQHFPHHVLYFCIFQNQIAISIQKNIEIYDIHTWTLTYRLYHNAFTYKMVFLSDTRLVSTDGKHLFLWDLVQYRWTRSGIRYGTQVWTRPLEKIVFLSMEHDTLYAGCRDGKVYVVHQNDGTIECILTCQFPFRSMARFNQFLVTLAVDEHALHVYHQLPGPVYTINDEEALYNFQASSCGQLIAVAKAEVITMYTSQFQEIWNVGNDYPILNLSMSFSPDSQLLATIGPRFKKIRILQAQTGNIINVCAGHESIIFTLAFHGNNTLISTSFDKTIRTWTVCDMSPLYALFYDQYSPIFYRVRQIIFFQKKC